VLNAQHGPIGYIDEVCGVYRVHGGGSGRRGRGMMSLSRASSSPHAIDRHFESRYKRAIRKRVALWHYAAAKSMLEAGIERAWFAPSEIAVRFCGRGAQGKGPEAAS